VPRQIQHPFWMVLFLVLTAVTFSLFGFIIGIWADSFEKLQEWCRCSSSRRSRFSVAVSIRSICCRRYGAS